MQIFIGSPSIMGSFCIVQVLNADVLKTAKKVVLMSSFLVADSAVTFEDSIHPVL